MLAEFFGPQPTPADQLPDPALLVRSLTRGALEALAGVREVDQLARWFSEEAYRSLVTRANLAARARSARGVPPARPTFVIRTVRVTHPRDGIVEAVVVVAGPGRTRAVALRLEGLDHRWRATDLAQAQGLLTDDDVEWLHRLAGDGQLLADLASADIVLWIQTEDGSFIAVAHARPSGAATLFYRDIVGERVRPQWRTQVQGAFESAEIVDSSSPDWFEETPTRVRAVPIVIERRGEDKTPRVIGVVTRHTNLGEVRTPSRQQITFDECANDLFRMIADGSFPDLAAPTSPRRGAPRASDGLIRIDVDGITTFASPNALSAFNRMGFDDELEGESLAEVTTRLVPPSRQVDESLPVVDHGTRIGAIVLCRDVSELRHQEQELITKDATIREIHHRVKNNLQTVASLLRIQARRTHSDEARDALTQAMRRVDAIAVVHDTLAQGLTQKVDFDEVFHRVLKL
ncbi:unnamed protein product, partial [Penicillium discolor]